MDENINLPKEKLNTPIFRIINFDRLTEILESKQNILSRPKNWDDPFEKLLSLVSIDGPLDMPIKTFGYYIYAQCWTFSEENDLLWRVYSPERDGVRIRSTPLKLLNSLKNSSTIKSIIANPAILEQWSVNSEEEADYVETPEGDIVPIMDTVVINQVILPFIGQVEYLTVKGIWNYLDRINNNSDLEDLIKSILIKREPFKNEEEVRFGVYNLDTLEQSFLQLGSGRFSYNFDINETFEEIVFDPRISMNKFEGLKNLIRNIGFNNPVLRSSIYDKPSPADLDPDIDYEYLFGQF
jgi:hypothetical protein